MDTTPTRDELRAHLRGLHADALSRIAVIDAATAELRRDRSIDTADDEHDPEGVTLSSEWAHLAGLHAAATRELAEIDEALLRSDAGTYGICIDCGRSIPIARLRARPAATRCVICAEKAGG
jgi:RNA polymerase-binding transcription factor DksA